jgi:hypothetical protein
MVLWWLHNLRVHCLLGVTLCRWYNQQQEENYIFDSRPGCTGECSYSQKQALQSNKILKSNSKDIKGFASPDSQPDVRVWRKCVDTFH